MSSSTNNPDPITQPWQSRCLSVLDYAFGGLHHAGRYKICEPTSETFGYVETSTFQELSTVDADLLTRLVFASLRFGVRVTVMPSGPRLLKLRLHPRHKREGLLHERIPTPETALEQFRKRL